MRTALLILCLLSVALTQSTSEERYGDDGNVHQALDEAKQTIRHGLDKTRDAFRPQTTQSTLNESDIQEPSKEESVVRDQGQEKQQESQKDVEKSPSSMGSTEESSRLQQHQQQRTPVIVILVPVPVPAPSPLLFMRNRALMQIPHMRGVGQLGMQDQNQESLAGKKPQQESSSEGKQESSDVKQQSSSEGKQESSDVHQPQQQSSSEGKQESSDVKQQESSKSENTQGEQQQPEVTTTQYSGYNPYAGGISGYGASPYGSYGASPYSGYGGVSGYGASPYSGYGGISGYGANPYSGYGGM